MLSFTHGILIEMRHFTCHAYINFENIVDNFCNGAYITPSSFSFHLKSWWSITYTDLFAHASAGVCDLYVFEFVKM